MQEIGCPPTASKAKLRFESVSFSELPGQSRLFLQYQADPTSLQKYYPTAVSSHLDVARRRKEVLDAYVTDRTELCDILSDQNSRFGAGEKTARNIDLLRANETVAVLTGQQTGLFTGPLYTIYKALSAIRMAACLQNRGLNAVPVFWAATEDHDFDEIAKAFLLGNAGEEVVLELHASAESAGKPVGSIPLSATFETEIRQNLDALPQTEFVAGLWTALAEAWRSGRTIGEAFCAHLQQLFGEHGLIVVDPLDKRLKQLSAPIYSQAVNRAGDIVPALATRSEMLDSDGYHSQVLITPDYFPLFYHTDDGVRRSIRRRDDGYRVSETDLRFSRDELAHMAANEPERLSPGVMLRPVVQDYLFPTICYFGGGAEIAYFAQNSEVYRILDRPVTPILHRQSFTVVDARNARTLDKYDLRFTDLFKGFEPVTATVVERFVNPTTSRLFADAEENINLELNRLDQELSRIDPTLGENLATRRRKVLYHIAALRKKFHRVQIERDEIADRQLRALFNLLLPDGQLQERRLNVGSFLARYGPYFIDWVYDSIDLDERGHRLLYL